LKVDLFHDGRVWSCCSSPRGRKVLGRVGHLPDLRFNQKDGYGKGRNRNCYQMNYHYVISFPAPRMTCQTEIHLFRFIDEPMRSQPRGRGRVSDEHGQRHKHTCYHNRYIHTNTTIHNSRHPPNRIYHIHHLTNNTQEWLETKSSSIPSKSLTLPICLPFVLVES
jgi:hypothetical protein